MNTAPRRCTCRCKAGMEVEGARRMSRPWAKHIARPVLPTQMLPQAAVSITKIKHDRSSSASSSCHCKQLCSHHLQPPSSRCAESHRRAAETCGLFTVLRLVPFISIMATREPFSMLVPGNPARFWAGVLCALAVPTRTVKHTTTTTTTTTTSCLPARKGSD